MKLGRGEHKLVKKQNATFSKSIVENGKERKIKREMKRKQEQGSMQTQGEVQELGIEEWLSNKFPLDTIQEIKKGERGADCLQIIHTRTHQNCGTIYYESKRLAKQPCQIDRIKESLNWN